MFGIFISIDMDDNELIRLIYLAEWKYVSDPNMITQLDARFEPVGGHLFPRVLDMIIDIFFILFNEEKKNCSAFSPVSIYIEK